jgi:hypothetical protein
MAKVNIERFRSQTTAECEQCDRLHPDSTRERARQHAAVLGHTVHVVIEDTTVYRKAQP